MMEVSDQMGVPVIVIGETVIIGYDPEEIKKAIKKENGR